MTSLRAALIRRLLHWVPTPISDEPLEKQRAMADRTRVPRPRRTIVQPVTDGSINAEWIIADNARRDRAILYLHGGAYIQKSPGMHRGLVARLSAVSGMAALMLDYRLAPEHPFPAALEDAVAAYQWLLRQGFDPAQIAFAGDSAGGGLLIAALFWLRDRGEHLPAAGVCLSPWTDVTMEQASPLDNVDPLLRREPVRRAGEWYAAGHDPCDPLISPVYGHFHGLPPLLIQVGEYEILRRDSERLAMRAQAAGVRVVLEVAPGMWHVWQGFPSFMVPESGRAVQQIGAFLRTTVPIA